MNNESIICTPVMIVATPENHPAYMMFGKPQHLYLVEDRRPKMGEWYFNQDRITQNTLEETDLPPYWKTVVSATDKSLSLPLVPLSFIERWVEKQGKIDRIKLKIENPFEHLSPEKPPLWQLALDKNDFVIILPIEDKTFSRKEMVNMLIELSYDLQQEKYGGCSTHKHIVSEFMKAHNY